MTEDRPVPDLGSLLNETFEDFFQKKLAGYVLGYLGIVLVQMPIMVLLIMLVYFLMIAGVVGIMVFAGVAVAVLGEDLGSLVGACGMCGGYAALFAGLLALGPVISVILAPFTASFSRAVAAQQRGEQDMTIGSSFATAMENPVGVALVGAIYAALSAIGLMLCYLPALLVPILFGFAFQLVALHRQGVLEAMATNLRHVQRHPGWHLMYFGLSFAMALVASYVPILGGAFVYAWHIRVFRSAFGDA